MMLHYFLNVTANKVAKLLPMRQLPLSSMNHRLKRKRNGPKRSQMETNDGYPLCSVNMDK